MVTGFFVLRRCDRPAAGACPSCGRPVCPQHFTPEGRCPECVQHSFQDPYRQFWTYGHRRAHYHHTTTVYGNDTWYPSFDQDDRDAFEPGGGDWAAASGDFGGDEWDGSDTGSGDWDSGGDDGLVDS